MTTEVNIRDVQIASLEATKACPCRLDRICECVTSVAYGVNGICPKNCACKGIGRVPILGDELRVECQGNIPNAYVHISRGQVWSFPAPRVPDEVCKKIGTSCRSIDVKLFRTKQWVSDCKGGCRGRGWIPSDDMGAWMDAIRKLTFEEGTTSVKTGEQFFNPSPINNIEFDYEEGGKVTCAFWLHFDMEDETGYGVGSTEELCRSEPADNEFHALIAAILAAVEAIENGLGNES